MVWTLGIFVTCAVRLASEPTHPADPMTTTTPTSARRNDADGGWRDLILAAIVATAEEFVFVTNSLSTLCTALTTNSAATQCALAAGPRQALTVSGPISTNSLVPQEDARSTERMVLLLDEEGHLD
jgi:hypothetical protein